MKLARALAVLMLLIMDVSFFAAAQTPSGTETGIEGVITISPPQPGPVRVDAPASEPLANTAFVVENENAAVASFTTDDHGRFRIQLPPGHYTAHIKGRQRTIGHFASEDFAAPQTFACGSVSSKVPFPPVCASKRNEWRAPSPNVSPMFQFPVMFGDSASAMAEQKVFTANTRMNAHDAFTSFSNLDSGSRQGVLR